MRITGGKARGIQLRVPRSGEVRPATDMLREKVFSCLSQLHPPATVVDLFAGSGSYGLEAMSRWGSHVQFVEKHQAALTCLRGNLQSVSKSCGEGVPIPQVWAQDVWRGRPSTAPRVEIVFADPPYDLLPGRLEDLLTVAASWMATDVQAWLVLEAPGQVECRENGWHLQRRLGGKPHQPSALILRRE